MKQQLREQVKALILDMDGVLWKESDAIGDLPQVFNHIQALGLDYVLATNNATKTQAKYVEKLAGFGAQIPEEKIVNSSMAVAYLLRKRFPSGGNVYIVGETGLVEALEHASFHQAE